MLAILGNTLNQNVTVGIDACLIQLNEQHTPNLPKSTIRIYIYILLDIPWWLWWFMVMPLTAPEHQCILGYVHWDGEQRIWGDD